MRGGGEPSPARHQVGLDPLSRSSPRSPAVGRRQGPRPRNVSVALLLCASVLNGCAVISASSINSVPVPPSLFLRLCSSVPVPPSLFLRPCSSTTGPDD